MGAEVTVLDRSITRLEQLDEQYAGRLRTIYSTAAAIDECAQESDLIIGAVLIPGASAPKLISRSQLTRFKPGTVMVDVAIDQGGCFETSKPTTHAQPTYQVANVVHYCVANMPGAVAKTATMALTNATLPYIMQLAQGDVASALQADVHFGAGLNVYDGQLTHAAVATALGESYVPAVEALNTPMQLKTA
jgi:alanine dehydrogenase